MPFKLWQKKPNLYICMSAMELRTRKRKDKEKEEAGSCEDGRAGQTWCWHDTCWMGIPLLGGQRSLFYLLPNLFMQVESSWGNQAVNWLIGLSFSSVSVLWQGERMSWWVRLVADELVLFTSRGSAPFHFWGEITVYHLCLVRVVTALCHTLTWDFWGENWKKVDRK